MNEKEQTAYIEGRKSLARELFKTTGQELGIREVNCLDLQTERNEAIAILRRLADDYGGDPSFPDDLHIADIISKYIEPILDDAYDGPSAVIQGFEDPGQNRER